MTDRPTEDLPECAGCDDRGFNAVSLAGGPPVEVLCSLCNPPPPPVTE